MLARSSLVAAIASAAAVASLVSLAPVAHADPDYTPPPFLSKPPELPADIDATDPWRLDLAEALQIAMHQNLGIAIERQTLAAAELGTVVATGPFEPVVTANYSHNYADSPPMTLQAGMPGQILTTTNDQLLLGVSEKVSTGATLSLSMVNYRSQSSAGTAVEPLVYNTGVTLSATQPLLRGFSLDRTIPQVSILLAKLGSDRERAQFAITAMTLVEQTEDAYWDVVDALYAYEVVRSARGRAADQVALTNRRIAAGLAPPSELNGAETTLAQQELTEVQAEQRIEQTWDRLRATLNLPHEQWRRPIIPTAAPTFATEHGTVDQAVQLAVANRPELAQVAIDLRSEELNIRQSENNQLPEIDLQLAAGTSGQNTAYGDAFTELGRADAPNYAVGVNVIWTPHSHALRAATEVERAKQKIAIANRDKAIQDTWTAVRDAVRLETTAERTVLAAAKLRELAEKTLDTEQRSFATGGSTQFTVSQRQDAVTQAQQAELDALIQREKQHTALLHATGQLLAERGIALAK